MLNIWKPVLVIVIAATFAVGSLLAIRQWTSPQKVISPPPAPAAPQATPKEKARVQLSLVPKTPTLKVGEEGIYQVVIDPQSLGVSGVETSLTFDPKLISIISIDPATYLNDATPLIENINPQGKIAYTLASLDYSEGQGVIFTISFQAQAVTNQLPFKFERSLTKVGLQNPVLDKRYAEDEVEITFTETPISILP